MKTQTKYEEKILAEIRTLPIPVLPQALKMLRSFREAVTRAVKHKTAVANESTGLAVLGREIFFCRRGSNDQRRACPLLG
jgi:hypothetical protein